LVKIKAFLRGWAIPPHVDALWVRIKRAWRSGGDSDGWFTSVEDRFDPSRAVPGTLHDFRTAAPGEVLWAPVRLIRYPGTGVAFTREQHHMVRYFSDGIASLRRFYTLHQPKNQIEQFFLKPGEVGPFRELSFPVRRVPWDFEDQFLGSERHRDVADGWQAFGPVSNRKLRFEAKRLDGVLYSVRARGFWQNPNRSDNIQYMLLIVSPYEYRVVVTNAQHRTATLSYLGWPLVPMSPREGGVREVRLDDICNWPGVLDGTYSEKAARAVFMAFFRDPEEILLPSW